MRRILLVMGLLVTGAGALAATDGPGSPTSGRRLAVEMCGGCHVVAPNQERGNSASQAPNLMQRVRDPAITELALRSYLQTSHPVMPNIMLSQDQTDDIIAYLLTFKKGAP
ncbi:c-type cytochrome [Azospirillum sp. sgz301742]